MTVRALSHGRFVFCTLDLAPRISDSQKLQSAIGAIKALQSAIGAIKVLLTQRGVCGKRYPICLHDLVLDLKKKSYLSCGTGDGPTVDYAGFVRLDSEMLNDQICTAGGGTVSSLGQSRRVSKRKQSSEP